MTEAAVLDILRQSLWTALIVSTPILAVALGCGSSKKTTTPGATPGQTSTTLKNAVLIELEKRDDPRGWFARTFCEAEFAAQGLETADQGRAQVGHGPGQRERDGVGR